MENSIEKKEIAVEEEIKKAQQKIVGSVKKREEQKKDKNKSEHQKDFLEQTIAEEKDLEETLAREAATLSSEIVPTEDSLQFSQKPVQELHQEMIDLNQTVNDKGYISREEEEQVGFVLGAIEKKLEAVETGDYSFTEETARAANLTQQVGRQLRGLYSQNRKQRDLYNSE